MTTTMKLKRYLIAMLAAAATMTACNIEELEQVRMVDDSAVVAPILNAVPTDLVVDATNLNNTAVFTWAPADFGVKTQIDYAIYAVVGGREVQLFSGINETSYEVLNSILNVKLVAEEAAGGLGLEPEQLADIGYKVGATVGKYPKVFYSDVVNTTVTPAAGDVPLTDQYEHVFVVGDFQGWADGEAALLDLFDFERTGTNYSGLLGFGGKAANGWKIRGTEKGWDDSANWGLDGDAATPDAEASPITLICSGGSKDIKIYSKNFYLMTFDKSALSLKVEKSFDKLGLIGINGDWDNDVPLKYNTVSQKFYADLDLAAESTMKVRSDGNWSSAYNIGGTIDAPVNGINDNMTAPAGQYRVYVDLNNPEKIIITTNPAKYQAVEEGDDDGSNPDVPVITPPEGYGIVGSINGWGSAEDGSYTDIMMTETDGVYVAYITVKEDNAEIKIRKDGAWVESYGGTLVELATPFEAISDNGPNIIVPKAGFYKVEFNLAELTIMLTEGDIWGIVGSITGWADGKDIVMTEGDEGVWTGTFTTTDANAEIKVRHNMDWALNYGIATGATMELGTAFAIEAGGPNIVVPEAGEYKLTLDLNANTILIEYALPSDTWSLIGVNGDWNNDIFMTRIGTGLWVSEPTAMSGEFKLRYNHDWGVNRGGASYEPGVALKVSQDGANINVPEGTYQIVYNDRLETITINPTGEWSVIGGFEGHNWDWDLYLSKWADGTYHSEPFIGNGEIKIRFAGGWDVNRGHASGSTTEIVDGEAVDVNAGGGNLKVPAADQAYVLSYDPANEKVTVTKAWAVIGGIEGDSWGRDFFMCETANGVWETVVTIDGQFKIRKSGDWNVNWGADGDDEPVALVDGTAYSTLKAGGKNFTVASTGKKYRITYDSNAATITATPAE